jgi:hypothetical protein
MKKECRHARHTGDKIFAGVVDTDEQFIADVNDTSDKYSFANISQIFEKIQNVPNGILGAWRTLTHEKNLNSKISCQTPFKESLFLSLL